MTELKGQYCESFCICLRTKKPTEQLIKLREALSDVFKMHMVKPVHIPAIRSQSYFTPSMLSQPSEEMIKREIERIGEENINKKEVEKLLMKARKRETSEIIIRLLHSKVPKITAKMLDQKIPLLEEVFTKLQEYNINEIDLISCSDFSFDLKRFKPVGELVFPKKLALRPELIERIGEAELMGFSISFKKSSIGLRNTRITQRDNNLVVEVTFHMKFSVKKDKIINVYNHGCETSKLFVEAR